MNNCHRETLNSNLLVLKYPLFQVTALVVPSIRLWWDERDLPAFVQESENKPSRTEPVMWELAYIMTYFDTQRDLSAEPPIKKQWTSSPSSDWGSETNHGMTHKSKKKKKRKKKEPKSEPTMATDSETEETEEQQEKCQWVRKWKVELQVLKDYRESHNILLHNLPEWGSCSHMGYLESCISEPGTGFFIKSIKT